MSTVEFAVETVARNDDAGYQNESVARRDGKVLLVVGDDLKRAALSRLLHRRGYVFTVAQGVQGLLAQLHVGGIDLVVCEAQETADAGFIAAVCQAAPSVPVMMLAAGENQLERDPIDCAIGLSLALGRAPEGRSVLSCLTTREREVLERIVAGRANKMIAYELSISPRTVENHRARVMEKLRAKTVADLVRIALTAGCGAPSSSAVYGTATGSAVRAMTAR